MKVNVGGLDSFIRIFAGVWLTYWAMYGTIGCWGFLGIILILTGIGRTCPVYCAIGASSECCEQPHH